MSAEAPAQNMGSWINGDRAEPVYPPSPEGMIQHTAPFFGTTFNIKAHRAAILFIHPHEIIAFVDSEEVSAELDMGVLFMIKIMNKK